MSKSDDQADALTQVENFYQEKDKVLPGFFAHSDVYFLYHQYRIIHAQLFWTTGMCLLAAIIVSTVVISHPIAVLIVLGVMLMVFVDLLGCIPLCGVSLNSISMINMVMAIGLVVDYNMHIVHGFMKQDPQLPRDKRTVLAMKELGVPVAKGVFSTFLGILPAAFGRSEIPRIFFKLFLAIVLVGGTHGLVLMPVVLSIAGPPARMAHSCMPKERDQVAASVLGHAV